MSEQRGDAPAVNVVVRSCNEEDWIRSCLATIFNQEYPNFFVTLVDSGSSDATVRIASEYTDVNVVTIEDYKPGRAIMEGIRNGIRVADYAFVVSAHCLLIGSGVLSHYVAFLEANAKVAGAYGRQLPMHFTSSDDTRDLLNTFGVEPLLQKRDSFFHNANSMIRMLCLDSIPIDEDAKHIEDRLWAEAAIAKGWHVAYLPDAAVYHYHGLNQHGRYKSFRADGVASILRSIKLDVNKLPYEMVHQRMYVAPTIILCRRGHDADAGEQLRIANLLDTIDLGQPCFVLTDHMESMDICRGANTFVVSRSALSVQAGQSFRELSRLLLEVVEKTVGFVVDGLSFVDMSYEHLKTEFLELARSEVFENDRRGVVPAWEDYGNFWMRDEHGFTELDVRFDDKGKKSAVYRSALGQCGCIRASEIRSHNDHLTIDEFITTDDLDLIKRFRVDKR